MVYICMVSVTLSPSLPLSPSPSLLPPLSLLTVTTNVEVGCVHMLSCIDGVYLVYRRRRSMQCLLQPHRRLGWCLSTLRRRRYAAGT